MPSSATKTARAVHPEAKPVESFDPKLFADALARTASESLRLRQRYACLVDKGAGEDEQTGALRLAQLSDELLGEATVVYETNCGRRDTGPREDWRLHAGALWLASRQYVRRNKESAHDARRFPDHSSETLGRLTMGFDLEASALLFLQQALDAYRQCRPESRLSG